VSSKLGKFVSILVLIIISIWEIEGEVFFLISKIILEKIRNILKTEFIAINVFIKCNIFFLKLKTKYKLFEHF